MKTFSAKPKDVTRQWFVVDASELPLGRLATRVAELLIGKGKPEFTKHIDCGDFVIIVNAEKLVVTGKKLDQKIYYHHTGYPGGLKERTLAEQLERDPSKVIEHAVRGMLPVNKLRDARLIRLKIYNGPEHNHASQKPQSLKFKRDK